MEKDILPSNESFYKVLREPQEGHIAQIYRNKNYLVDSVSLYISSAIQKKEAIVLIATDEHSQLFEQQLKLSGNYENWKAQGLVKIPNAEKTLSLFMRNRMPDWQLFAKTIGNVLSEIKKQHPSIKITAYGEMVNLLWQGGNIEAALQLEEYWNDLSKLYSFSLFCAYYLRSDSEEMEARKLKEICRTHSHFIPTEKSDLTEKALGRAIEKVLGNKSLILRSLIEMLAKKEKNLMNMPDYLVILHWLEENMPQTTAEIKALTSQYLSEN